VAELTKTGLPSLSSVIPANNQKLSGMLAGEAIAAGDLCYLRNDGLVMRSSGAAVAAAAAVIGFAAISAPVGEAVTLLWDVNLRYGSGLIPGTKLYLSATVPGGLADVASTGGVSPIGYVVDATRVHIRQSVY